jgi:hypothetical protein
MILESVPGLRLVRQLAEVTEQAGIVAPHEKNPTCLDARTPHQSDTNSFIIIRHNIIL